MAVNQFSELSPEGKRALLKQLLERRAAQSKTFPLSFAQQRLWFLDRLEPGNPAYNIPVAVRLDGALDGAALQRALHEIVRRHQALRTTFTVAEGQPVQVVAPSPALPVPVVDLTDLPGPEREAKTEWLATEEAERPFDLARGPLVRASLLRLGAREHVLLLTLHHIVADGWSCGVVMRELAALYEAFAAGDPSPLPELPLQYADFAAWQRGWLDGEVLEGMLSYWRRQLAGLPPLELPTDRPRSAVQGFRGARQWLTLPDCLCGELRALARREGVTPFMLLLAAFEVVLHRYTGQVDVAVGSPIANRTSADTEGLIGFFVNTLVLRADLSGDPTFLELLARVRPVVLGAFAHQDVPFEKLVDELLPQRDRSRSPLFQVMFALQNAPMPPLELPGLTLRLLKINVGYSKFDMSLTLREVEGGLGTTLKYNRDLFDPATIARLLGHWQTLLEGIAADPRRRLSQLPLLTPPERQEVLGNWAGGRAAYPRGQCLHQWFEAQAERTPEAVAVSAAGQSLSYAGLNRRANRLAHHLRGLGVGPEALVAVCLERSAELVVALLGILKAGGAYLPLDPAYPAERLAFVLADSGAPVLVTDERLARRLPPHQAKLVRLDADAAALADASDRNPASGAGPDNLAYVIYTSGSTGLPKGVEVTHYNVARLFQATEDWFHFDHRDVWTLFHSCAFDFSVWELWGALLYGGRLVVVPYWVSRSPEAFYALLESERVTVLNQTPSAFRQLVAAEEGGAGDLALRLVIFGGEALELAGLRPWLERHGDRKPRLVNMYGITETTVHVTYRPLVLKDLAEAPGSVIGGPIPDLRLYVLDAHRLPVPVGVAGELYVGGAGVARGYLNRPELTAERFVDDPFLPGSRLYKSGDLARWRPGGDLQYLGRIDNQIKIRGFRIELGEIEAALGQHPAVRETVVVVREDLPGDKRLIAYVVASPESAPSTSELHRFLREKLPEHMVPHAFVLLEAMPLTANGKVDRGALPAPERERPELEKPYVAPQPGLEQWLAGRWQALLGVERVGTQDSFFELGGDSIKGALFINELQEAFQEIVHVVVLFDAPTIAALAAYLQERYPQAVARVCGTETLPGRASRTESPGSPDGAGVNGTPVGPTALPAIPSVPRGGELPLSFAQQRLWFLHQLEPHSPFYNVPAAVRLTGKLNPDALQRSLQETVRRHEVLRTTFATAGGRPVQVIAPAPEVPLPVVDLQHLPAAGRRAAVRRRARAAARRPFDLEAGPLLRAALLRQGPEDHVLLLTLHHIAADGWSVGVLVRELTALYTAFCQGRPADLPALPIQYADYAVWQRQWLQGEVLDGQLAYWRSRLAGAAPLALPTDRPRPAVLRYRGGRESRRLPRELAEGLRALSAREGATLFMTLLAAWQVLLQRYTGQDDVSVGTPTAGRTRAELEGLIGFFVNTLVLRADLSGDPTFQELLARVRSVVLGAFAHQDVPFEKLVDELQPQRDLSRTPLFQVVFSLQNAPREELRLPGLALRPLQGGSGTAKFDLILLARDAEDGLVATLKYNSDLFEPATIERLLGHWQTLLEGIVANPSRPLADLPLLTAAEERRFREEAAAPTAHYPPVRCLHDWFRDQAERTPGAVALSCAGESMTYAELNRRANRLAHHLRGLGVGPEALVAVCLERSAELVVALLGILKAGGAYLPLDPAYPAERLAFVLADSGAPVLVTQGDLARRLPPHQAKLVRLDADAAVLALQGTDDPASGATPDSLAYVIYTSGSTGRPKGVEVTHYNVARLFQATEDWFHFDDRDVWTLFHSYAFDFSVWELWGALLYGGRLVVVPYAVSRSPEEFYALLRSEGVTVLNQTPSAFRGLSGVEDRHGAADDLRLRLVVFGGEALELAGLRPWLERHGDRRPRLVNMYGITETTVHVTYRPLALADLGRAPGSVIGQPIPDLRLHVLDARRRPVPVGVAGELYVGGAGLARGYLNRPELTAERFVPDPFAPGQRLYKSGDLARRLADGDLQYLGRGDGQVKVRGFRVELGEIEAALARHPAVGQAVVVAGEGAPGEKRLAAYVVARPGEAPTTTELHRFLRDRLPQHMVPHAFLLLDSLPLTANGKVDRRALPAPEADRPELDSPYQAPRTALERLLAELWQELLGVSRVGADDSFFELGGDSIQAALFVNRLQGALREIVHVAVVFDAPTVAGLADFLGKHYPEAVARVCGTAAGGVGRVEGIDAAAVARLRRLIPPLPPRQGTAGKNPRALFVLAPPRSGTTLFRVMLGGHPRLFAPPELELLSFHTMEERKSAFSGRNSFWLEGALRAVMEVTGCDAEQARQIVADWEGRGWTTQRAYRQLQEWLGGRTLVDKSPSYALDVGILRRAEAEFQDPLYVHLLRHPRGMIRSFEEARLDQVFFRHPHAFPTRALAELVWVVSQQNILEFLREVPPERQHQVRFEELVRQPRATLEGVCRFLGLDFHADMAEPYRNQDRRMTDGIHPQSRMLGDVKFHRHQGVDARAADRWAEAEKGAPLGEVTREVAASLGYPVEDGPGVNGRAGQPALPAIPAAPRGGELPLSFAQQRLWFLNQLEPHSPFYNVPAAVRLTGRLNPAALQRSLQEIVRRHEVLRTTFATPEGRPVQVIAPAPEVPLPVIDLQHLPAAGRRAAVRRRARAAARRPFDLEAGPLLRAALLRQGPEEHVLLLTLHHIAADGWSVGVLVREVTALYTAFCQGRPAALPALPVQYADYAVWQRQWLQGDVLESQLTYWKGRLAGAAPLALATDRPRPAVLRYRGGRESRRLPRELAEGLRALSAREGATPFMTLLAAWQVLLQRYTGQDDVSVGTPTAGRTRAELEGLIGFFVNTLVLRADLSGDPTFRELLGKVREAATGAYAHQEVPFEKLVDELQPQRDLSRTPLFQVLFSLQNAPREALRLPGLTLRPLRAESGTAKFDLTLLVRDTGQGLRVTLKYNSDLFDAATARRLLRHWQTLLEGVVADPGRRLAELPLLTAAERREMLHAGQPAPREYPPTACLHQMVEARAERTPHAVAVSHEGRSFTYRELNERANQVAHRLRALGVGPDTLVGLCLERSLDLVVGVLGVLKAGGAYVPLDPEYPRERLAFLLADARVPVLVTQGHLAERLPEHHTRLLRLDADWPAIAREPVANPASGATPDSLAYVIYTSGSTGQPKGVEVTHYNVARLFQATEDWFHFDHRDVWTLFHSYAFDFSVWELWGALLYGGRLVVVPYAVSRSPEEFHALLRSEGVTVLNQTPSAFRGLAAADAAGPAGGLRLRLVIFGGEALELAGLRPWLERHGDRRPRLVNMYGITETTVHVTYRPLALADLGRAPGSVIGQPIPDLRLHVLDARRRPVPVGVAGELYVGGAGLARGYLNRPELTAERFVPDPFAPGQRLYKSGDLARRLADGDLQYLGRGDGQVKVRGFRVELGEIEAALARHPNVREVVVVARDEGAGGKRLVAYVVAREQPAPSPEELRAFAKQQLPEYMVPAAFVALGALPLTAHGKVDRRALPAPDVSRPELRETFVAPHSAREEVLAGIWGQVLGLEAVGVHDNFFALGGDSILSIQIVARANQAGLRLTPKHLFQHQTIAELAATADAGRDQAAEQGPVTGPVSLTPIQQWFFEQDLPEPHHCNQAVLLEVRRPLDPAVLERALHHLAVHHDALRLRFVRTAPGWQQFNAGPEGAAVPVDLVDLSALPGADQGAALEAKAAELQATLNLSDGPLARAAYFDLGAGRPGRLLLAVHHLAVDGVSWRVLLEDLLTALDQLGRGESPRLPPKTTSFRQWADQLTARARSEEVRREAEYWLAEARSRVGRLPVDFPGGANLKSAARTVAVALTEDETRGLLRELPEVYRTQVNDVLLSALARTLASWTGGRTHLVDLEGHGREEGLAAADLSRTVGWFTSLFPVLLDLGARTTPEEELKAVKEQLRRVPRGGVGYGLLRYLGGDADLAGRLRALPPAEVSFNYLGQVDRGLPESAPLALAREPVGPTHCPRGARTHLLGVAGSVSAGRLRLVWTYGAEMHRRETVERLAAGLAEALRSLLACCRAPGAGGYTPSDFPDADLSQDQLDKLRRKVTRTEGSRRS